MDAAWAAAVETHTAALFFAGDHVFKVKKPVRLDFVDLRTRAARRAACVAEAGLNRRLAPDVYLGVADITVAGEAIDHAVVMRRLPAEASLAARIGANDPDVSGMVVDVADVLAAFHARCRVVGSELPRDLWTPPAFLFRTEVERTARLTATDATHRDLERALLLADDYAAGRAQLFARRLDAGMVRDGHGDLQAADVYLLPDGPRVLDCLEFDERLRIADVLHDVAFLAMDLERLGRSDLSALFLERYSASARESHPSTLAHFFVAHRALVRAKVAAIRQHQVGAAADPAAAALLALTLRHLEAAQVRMVLVGGLPGSGKTTIAAALADELPAVHLSSDRVRHELAGAAPTRSGFDSGRYAPALTDTVYTELLHRAADAAAQGEHVVLDASWRSAAHREAARRVAREAGALLVELDASVDDSIAAARLQRRPPAAGGSEATVGIRQCMRDRFESWPSATALETARPLDEVLAAAEVVIATAGRAARSERAPQLLDVGGTR